MTGRRPFASLFACFDNAEAPCGRIDSARWCRAQTPCSPSSSAGASQTSSRRCGASVRSHPSSRVACRVAAATVLLVDRNLNPQEKLIRKVANEMLFSWFQSGRHYCSKKSTQTRTTLLSTRPRPLNAEERDAVQQSSLLPQCCRMAGVGGFLARLTRASRFCFASPPRLYDSLSPLGFDSCSEALERVHRGKPCREALEGQGRVKLALSFTVYFF